MRKLYERIKSIKLSENKICIILIVVFILEIIPMLLIAQYNFPSVDDFGFGIIMKHALEEQITLRSTVWRIFQEMWRNYIEWEGRFTAVFFNCLQPASFGEKFYVIVPYLMLSLVAIADLFLCYVFFGKFFGANHREVAIIFIVWFSISIQLVPSAVQAFYWYTGAAAYVIFYSLSIIQNTFLLLYIKEENRRKNILYIILNSFINFLVGGGNYVSAMLILLTYIIVFCAMVINKNKKWKALCIPFFMLVIPFIITINAPGNKVRAAGISIGVISAIWKSINFAVDSANTWLNISVIIAIIFLIPILWKIVNCSSFSFRYPALVTFFSCGLYAAQFCPHAYALGTKGPARLTNIIFFSFIFFLIFNMFYWLGWLNKKWEKINDIFSIGCNGSYSLIFVIIIVIGLGMSCNALRNQFPPTSIVACYSLLTGEAKQYYNENQERLILLRDDSIPDVVLKEYTKKPCVLFWDDGGEDPENWRNEWMSSFYGKNSIIIK